MALRAPTRTPRLHALMALGAAMLASNAAQARVFYFETETGVSQFRSADPYFPGNGIGNPTGLGVGVGTSLFFTFSDGNAPAEIQFGLQQRFESVTDSGFNFELLGVYPMVRVQLSRAFFSVGASPFIWQRVDSGFGFTNLGRNKGASFAYVGEAGVLWPMTPEFSLGAALSAQFVNLGGTLSPAPAADATVILRFYFGASSSGGGSSEHNSNENRGWRYPFGLW